MKHDKAAYFLALPCHMPPLADEQSALSAKRGQVVQSSFHSYVLWMLALIAGYLAAIIHLDDLACEPGAAKCYTYGSVELVFSADKVEEAITGLSPRGLRFMCLSAGLHIFGCFIFPQLMYTLGMGSRQLFVAHGFGNRWPVHTATALVYMSRTFNVTYLIAHCQIAAELTQGRALHRGQPTAIAIFIIISLIQLVLTAFHLVGTYGWLLSVWLRNRRSGNVANTVDDIEVTNFNGENGKPVAEAVARVV